MNNHHYHHHDDASGERFIPELMGGQLIDAEHQARYRFAAPLVAGKRVLDAGCGVGWGSKLLLEAGAASVVGLDIADEAIEDARRRAPECEFVQGDLQDLPLDDAEFDVVVCFEALEHVADTSKALDELVRVLRTGGVLLVSSPNPEVYPGGNEFHLHELTPAELAAEVTARLPHVQMYRQHQMLGSMIHAEIEDPDNAAPFAGWTYSVTGLGPGNDVYSLAVASHAELPSTPAWTVTAPLTQLQELIDERPSFVEQIDSANAQLRDADRALRSVMNERDDANQRLADVHTQWEATKLELANQRAVAENAARERDDLAARLVSALQRPDAATELKAISDELDDARRQVEVVRAQRDKARQNLKKARSRIRDLNDDTTDSPAAGWRTKLLKGRRPSGRA
jgi:ubiquinone/menaquinone biosynthesis C-methylase UbiE